MGASETDDSGVSPNGLQDGIKAEESHIEKLRTEERNYEIDPIVDRRITRKFDLHIIPWLFGIWYMCPAIGSSSASAQVTICPYSSPAGALFPPSWALQNHSADWLPLGFSSVSVKEVSSGA
ncbi:MAG: hypothetical protein Q9160_007681 [Pyrenula sp. 1 TL-2023]